MAGEVTSANVMTRFNALNADLNAKVKNGQMNVKDAQKQVADFRIKHDAEFKAYEATQAGAAQEAKDATTKALGADFSAAATAKGGADAATVKTDDTKETADADKPQMTKMQERLLKQAQQFYPEADVTLDKDGKVVVKDKKTGEIDEEKTKEAQKIKIDGTPIEQTLTQETVDPKAKVGLVAHEDAEKMRQLDTKEKAHDEFSDKTVSKEDIKAAKSDIKATKKELKDIQKQAKELRKAGKFDEADKLDEKYQELNDKLLDQQNNYEKIKVTGSTKGDKGIAKAAKHNAKQYDKIDNVNKVLLPGQEDDAQNVPEKGNNGKTVTLSQRETNTLGRLRSYADHEIKAAEKKLQEVKDSGDAASIKTAELKLEQAQTKYGDLAECMKDGKVDVSKLQRGLAQLSGGDYKFNIDEKKAIASAAGLKSGDISDLAKKVGFGNESKTKGKFIAGGAAAAATALASLIGPHKKSATASAHGESSVTAPDNTVVTENTETTFYKFMDSSGNPVYKEISATAKATATAKGLTATAVADAVAHATSKIPVLGQLAGPVVAGVSAFLLSNPQSKDAFNGNSVDTVLNNLQAVSGNDNKKIVAQIQDMTITGDPVRDKAIKAAVIEASINGKANTEELLAAYQSLKDTKKAIETIDGYQEPSQPTPPTPPTQPTPPTPPQKPDPKAVGGWARDHKLLDKHGIPQDQRDHNGVGKDRAQIVIADEDGEIAVTGKDMKEPDTITIKDNTNTKVNTFEYRKLTDEELKNGKTKDGVTLTGLNGKSGPFYVLVSAKDDKGNLKNNHTEVYQLELKVEEDENGDKYTYHLEQYDGMNGSGKSSMQWPNRATRTTRTTNPTRTTGKKKTTNTGKTRTAQQTTDRAKATPAGGNHGIPYKPVDAWVDMMPSVVPFGQQAPTKLDKIKRSAIAATKDRPMNEEQLKKLDECKTEAQAINYLRSLGINVKYAF